MVGIAIPTTISNRRQPVANAAAPACPERGRGGKSPRGRCREPARGRERGRASAAIWTTGQRAQAFFASSTHATKHAAAAEPAAHADSRHSRQFILSTGAKPTAAHGCATLRHFFTQGLSRTKSDPAGTTDLKPTLKEVAELFEH